MEDFQFLLYIVLGIIYMISKAIGSKNKKRQQPVEIDQSAGESPSEKPFSFEEILKEISKGVEKEVVPQEDTVRPVYEPIIEKKSEPVYDREAERTAYRSSRQPVIEEKLFNEEPQESTGFLDLLNEEGGAAKAVVLSEIFNRKY